MSQAKEVRNKIKSIKSTQKITSAMELVAVSKMRKAQQLMALTKPYADKIRQVIGHVASGHVEYPHPFLVPRDEIKRIGYIVVSSDRGLCGGLNINLFRTLLAHIKNQTPSGVETQLCLIGRKANAFFNRVGGNIVASAEHLGDKPKIQDLIGMIKVMLDYYMDGTIDALYIASNEFVNRMIQKPIVKQLLPLIPDESESKSRWDYIYEPDSAKEILDHLLRRYIESQVYQAVVENMACFQAAQMVAMKNATENASNLIKELQLVYNQARQASITAEISEIVAGADAVG
jgi:F-type H+-transporting ATPase subunit gamma